MLFKQFCGIMAGTFYPAYLRPIYVLACEILQNLYCKFDYFASEWHLNEYDEFKNDISKQKKLHDEFKILIQVLLGFSCAWYCNMDDLRNTKNIVKSQIRGNPSNNRITLNDKYRYIDVNPQSESELESLYNVMKQGYDDVGIIEFLKHPQTDIGFERYGARRNWTDIGRPMEFADVTEPYLLFYKMWKIYHSPRN